MMSYKEMWNAKYEELAWEKYDCDYWDCTPEQQDQLASLTDSATRDHFADMVDRATDEAKYRGLK